VVSRAVVLDVVVTDGKGHPVKGLKKSDFALREDGAPQTLKSFEEHNSGAAATPEAGSKLPANTYTNLIAAPNSSASTVLLIDAENTDIDAQMYLHEQLVDYIRHMTPGTSMAIFVLAGRMHLVQGFTTDQQVLLEAINRRWAKPNLGFFEGGNSAYRHFRRDILHEGMQELGRYLAGFPGRKNLIWFNNPGMIADAYRIFAGDGEIVAVAAGTGLGPQAAGGVGPAGRGASNGAMPNGFLAYEEPWDLIGIPFRDTDNFNDDLSETTDVLTLSRVAVYPVDARGLIAGGSPHAIARAEVEDSYMSAIAEATGGKSFYSTNDLEQAVAEVVETGSNYYTVSYTPTNNNWNGKFRRIKVEINGQKLNLEYRKGYLARDREEQEQRHLAAAQRVSGKFIPTAETEAGKPPGVLIHRGPDESLQASMTLGAIPPTELIFAASLAPSEKIEKTGKKAALPRDNYLRPKFHSEPYRNYHVLYATDAATLGFRRTPDGIRHDQIDFVAVVYTGEGDVVNSLITSMHLDLSEASYLRLVQTGLIISQRIAVPVKGTYFLRLGIRDAAGDRVGAMELPLGDVKAGGAGAGQTVAP
jgi:VWFA-related protein